MAWKFLNLHDPRAAKRQQRILGKIDRWWAAFEKRVPALDALFRRQRDWNLARWMAKRLQTINRNLMWEFGPNPEGGYQLIITPESRKDLRPLVETILERAPQLAGWRFLSHRPAEPLGDAIETVRAQTEYDITDCRVQVRRGEAHGLELLFHMPDCLSEEDELATASAWVTAECLLGEETLDHWVDTVQVTPEAGSGRWLGLERLRERAEALIQSRVDQLPSCPCHEMDRNQVAWNLFKVQPTEEAEDYPGTEDLLMGVSMLEDLWMNAHSGQPFYSLRYSRFGERFAYLKIDGSDDWSGTRFRNREEIEETLGKALMQAKLGCVIGGGTGRRYSYIDLALTEIRPAFRIIQPILRDGRLPGRTWLLFFDCEWAREWLGLYDNSPPPPR
jgi:hypothetical protein